MSEVAVEAPKRKRGRPSKADIAARASLEETGRTSKRVPISGQRDNLQVEGKDPDFYYRWVKDTAENGSNILKHTRAGYSFARDEEGLVIGEANVYRSENVGSCIRVPAGFGEYLYLMKQPMRYREEDLQLKAQGIDEVEDSMRHANEAAGEYGSIKIERK